MTLRRCGSITVETSNETKLMFPANGIDKGDLIDYYGEISDHLLPHLLDRPLVMQRFPDGIDEGGFFQKQVPDHFPEWIRRVRVEKKNGSQDLVICESKATLVYLADQACITFHRWLSRVENLRRPDLLILDLDPSENEFQSVRSAALVCRDLFAELDLPCFAMATGSRGLHVTVPLDGSLEFDRVREFVRGFARLLAARWPERFTVERRKNKRGKRLYLDVGRNAYAQTAVTPYAVRPLPAAPVAAPIRWGELESGRIKSSRDFTIKTVLRRLARIEEPWQNMRRRQVALAPAIRRLEELLVALVPPRPQAPAAALVTMGLRGSSRQEQSDLRSR